MVWLGIGGIYGAAHKHLLPDLDALEAAMQCRLYREWPVCEVSSKKTSKVLLRTLAFVRVPYDLPFVPHDLPCV
eukprot:5013559-Amphidinium_carterae.1